MAKPPNLAVPGLTDPRALGIIRTRWHSLHKHLSPYFNADHPWYDALRIPEGPQQRSQLLIELERAITAPSENQNISGKEQVASWQERVLSPLARDLGFFATAERALVLRCLGRGWFDVEVMRKSQRQRPEIDDILPQVHTVLESAKTIEQRSAALKPLCRDDHAAEDTAKELTEAHIARHALSFLFGQLCAFGEFGVIGLLSRSDYLAADELLILEREADSIARLTQQPQSVMATLRQDLIALHQAMKQVHDKLWNPKLLKVTPDRPKEHKHKREQKDLWQPHLLHEPPNSDSRKLFIKSLYPRLRTHIVTAIEQHRPCDPATADKLLDLLGQAGLPGLIDWRCGLEAQTVQHVFELQRTLHALEHVTVGMASWAQHEIERLVRHLLTVRQIVGLPLTLNTLIVDSPSSRRRVRWGRRLWFGVPAIMRRRQRRRRHSGLRLHSQRKRSTNQTGKTDPRADQLVTQFAELAQLDEQDARTRLRDFLTYGVLGLLPREQWKLALDERVVSWLQLIKLGRLDGTVAWSTVLRVAGEYCRLLNIPRPSAQVMRALFNSLPKPSYWHGGKGRAVDGVRQRATLSISGRPRLHKTWMVIWFPIHLQLAAGKPKQYFMLLVIDEGSQLPMGGWLSEQAPGIRELGLAIYQSIWHPGIVEWPLRGIPETFRVPMELLREEMTALERAAASILIDLEAIDSTTPEGQHRIRQMREALQAEPSCIEFRVSPSRAPASHTSLETFLTWLWQDSPDDVREVVQVPKALISSELSDLEHAATFLLSTVEIVARVSLEGKPNIRSLRKKLRQEASQIVSSAARGPMTSLGTALRALLTWIKQEQFPDHRPALLPDEIAKHGVGMSGHNTLAAGWLLPEVDIDSADAESGSVIWQSRRYRSIRTQGNAYPGMKARAYPYIYSRRSHTDVAPGIFVEVTNGGMEQLIFLDCIA